MGDVELPAMLSIPRRRPQRDAEHSSRSTIPRCRPLHNAEHPPMPTSTRRRARLNADHSSMLTMSTMSSRQCADPPSADHPDYQPRRGDEVSTPSYTRDADHVELVTMPSTWRRGAEPPAPTWRAKMRAWRCRTEPILHYVTTDPPSPQATHLEDTNKGTPRQRYRQPPTRNFSKKRKVAFRDDEQRTLTILRQFAGNKDTEASGSYFLSTFPDGETVQWPTKELRASETMYHLSQAMASVALILNEAMEGDSDEVEKLKGKVN
ncbi:activator of 90 kDa heat shock protein [Striga asiatica]|uniref:Activator of 90 kDa heat shock protein n=1 Tax=Striga asiatica TaxID=4170 RepID=A0A5A7NXP1_STRAF|nr:activator of 90 kDa heat shock protein [Striga asiatica]